MKTFRWDFIIIALIVFLFGILVWPTPYEYTKMGPGSYYQVCTNRITGSVWIMNGSNWRLMTTQPTSR
jgi:hypothetical protein